VGRSFGGRAKSVEIKFLHLRCFLSDINYNNRIFLIETMDWIGCSFIVVLYVKIIVRAI